MPVSLHISNGSMLFVYCKLITHPFSSCFTPLHLVASFKNNFLAELFTHLSHECSVLFENNDVCRFIVKKVRLKQRKHSIFILLPNIIRKDCRIFNDRCMLVSVKLILSKFYSNKHEWDLKVYEVCFFSDKR